MELLSARGKDLNTLAESGDLLLVFDGEFHPDYKDLIESTKINFKLNIDLIVEIN